MAERNVRLLDTGDHGAGDDEGMVHEVAQLAAGPAGPADRHEPLCLRRLHALQDVRGVAAGTDADRHVARMAQRLDLSGKERLVSRVPGTLSVQDITRDGRVLLTEDNMQVGIVTLPRGETNEKNFSWFDWSLVGDLSPDGRVLVFSESGEAVGARYGVFIRKTDGSPAIRLGDGGHPVLSPDGKWVATPDLSSPQQIVLLPTGAGPPRRLTSDSLDHAFVAWVPDGTGLVFIAAEPNHSARSYWMDLNGKTRALTPEGTSGSVVTPDSKFLLAEDPQHKRLLYPLQGGEPKPLPASLDSEDNVLRFEPDGRSLLVAERGIPVKILRVFLGTNRREEVRQISPSDPAGVQSIPYVVFSADEKSYAYSYYRVLSDLWVVDGLR